MHRVLIAHPARQHSLELAVALEDAGWLQAYLTMLPDERALGWLPKRLLPTALARNPLSRIPRDRVRILHGPLLLAKAARRAGRAGAQMELAAWTIFDRWVAKAVRKSRPSVVVGFEMCCVETFAAAKEVGASAVLDAAALHYRHQDEVLGNDRPFQTAEVALRRRKQQEIDCADLIVCCSEVGRNSYVAGGVAPERILLNPLGCDTALFAPAGPDRRSGPPKFAFAGTASWHKGVDVLSDAFTALRADHPDAELHVAGDRASAEEFFNVPPQNLTFYGKLPQPELAALFAKMDCLILPSRLDSFGMVVVEALASGLPVIVTSAVGAAQAITPGVNGWIVEPGDAEALARRMRQVCGDVAAIRAKRPICIASAKNYDWRRYRARAVDIIGSLSEYRRQAEDLQVAASAADQRDRIGVR